MYKEFGHSFFNAEKLIVTGIYPSREKPIEGVTGQLVSDTAKRFGHKSVHYLEEITGLPQLLKEVTQKGDIVITMGAGDIYKYCSMSVE